jgi:hypothetical protein
MTHQRTASRRRNVARMLKKVTAISTEFGTFFAMDQ